MACAGCSNARANCRERGLEDGWRRGADKAGGALAWVEARTLVLFLDMKTGVAMGRSGRYCTVLALLCGLSAALHRCR